MLIDTAHEIYEPTVAHSRVHDCGRCFDIGMHVSPMGKVVPCPVITAGATPHPELSVAGARIQLAVKQLRRREIEPDSFHFEIARTLAAFTSNVPCCRDELIDRHFSYVSGVETRRRKIAQAVKHLLDEWLLPVGSRKALQSGYWIITDEADFSDWWTRATSEPITRLTTLHRLAKANFPIFAQQIELDFWRDIEAQPPAA